jgi:hypothetical protein
MSRSRCGIFGPMSTFQGFKSLEIVGLIFRRKSRTIEFTSQLTNFATSLRKQRQNGGPENLSSNNNSASKHCCTSSLDKANLRSSNTGENATRNSTSQQTPPSQSPSLKKISVPSRQRHVPTPTSKTVSGSTEKKSTSRKTPVY